MTQEQQIKIFEEKQIRISWNSEQEKQNRPNNGWRRSPLNASTRCKTLNFL